MVFLVSVDRVVGCSAKSTLFTWWSGQMAALLILMRCMLITYNVQCGCIVSLIKFEWPSGKVVRLVHCCLVSSL